jgi:hypothetical protein
MNAVTQDVVVEQQQSAVVDTAQIQYDELLGFAFALGFTFNGKSFVRDPKNALLKTVTTLSFDTMVQIYNSPEKLWEISFATCGKYSFFIFNPLITEGQFNQVPFYTKDVEFAFGGKGLKKVKLQLTRKSELVVLSHKIEFLNVYEGHSFKAAVDVLIQQGVATDE